jgi:hypothetical protein
LISGSSKPHGKSQPCFENSDPYDLALYFWYLTARLYSTAVRENRRLELDRLGSNYDFQLHQLTKGGYDDTES